MIVNSGCLADVLTELATGSNAAPPVRITVRRNSVWLDALQEVKAKHLSVSTPLKVKQRCNDECQLICNV